MIDPNDNSQYGDGFPMEDHLKKKDSVKSKDSSRPFDFGSKSKDVKTVTKNNNPTGTTMNEKDKYKK